MNLVLASSGLGYTRRGIETWMADLAVKLSSDRLSVELWSGGLVRLAEGIRVRHLHALNRDGRLLQGMSWGRRYNVEQLSILPRALSLLGRQKVDVVYCGDPLLSWHLRKFHRLHKAKVVFMNGMRICAEWAQAFDGVHLLAPA